VPVTTWSNLLRFGHGIDLFLAIFPSLLGLTLPGGGIKKNQVSSRHRICPSADHRTLAMTVFQLLPLTSPAKLSMLDLAGHMLSEGRILSTTGLLSPPHSEGYIISKALHKSSWLCFSSSGYLSNFFPSVIAISTLNVLAHRLILGSVQHLYASSIYVLFLPAPPTLFLSHLILAYFSTICTPMYCLL
jgi:hypothetical protein